MAIRNQNLDDRLTTAEGEIDTAQTDITTAQGDILALEADAPHGTLGVVVSAEDANVITVTYSQLTAGGDGDTTDIHLQLIVAGGVLADGTAFCIDDVTGTVVGADVAGGNVQMVITPTAAGAVVVTVTDKAGASGATRYLVATAVGPRLIKVSTITFD